MERTDKLGMPSRRTLGALILSIALLALGVVAYGAIAPKVANPHGKFKEQCSLCHGANGWKPAKISSRFDHGKFGFVLAGAHAAANCMSCHQSLEFLQSKCVCASCHKDPHRGELGTDCAKCHGSRSFTDRGPMVRAHQLTRFPLTGGHATIDCESCHKASAQGQMQFVGTQAECKGCHMSAYQGAKNPDHVAGGYPLDCQTCHAPTTWSGAKFDHSATGFPLTGAHTSAACAGCHGDGVYKGKSKDCQSCHMDKYNTATPPHAAAGYMANACAGCHTTSAWAGAKFDHSGFALTNSHAGLQCNQCHGDGLFKGKSTDCQTCHMDKYNAATPPHPAAGFSASSCASCHNTIQWAGAVFNHNNTAFPLTGAHTSAACSGCHGDGVYKGKSTDCQTCHMDKFNGATPNHVQAGFPASQCATCHTTAQWAGGQFNHSNTAFPLTGAHVATPCSGCHGNGVYKGLAMDCASCHMDKYTGAASILDHTKAGFPASACVTCHNTSAWSGASFNHNTSTSFPLTGAHVGGACLGCHSNGVYHGHASDCASCHMTEYTGAASILDHAKAGFAASACATCHTTAAWAGASFNHNTNTSFPLTGAHISTACSGCHGTGIYNGLATDCQSCHMTQYNGATPNHSQAGFPASQCATCHTTTTFTGGTFNHNTTSFPLTGAHISTACSGCHGDGVYNGKATNCMSCHSSTFNTQSVPKHNLTDFPDAMCATCHTTTAWTNGKITSHTNYYPTTHHGASCTDCHTNTTNYMDNTCTTAPGCHTRTKINSSHNGRNGYTPNAPDMQCVNPGCHYRGSKG